MVPEGKPLVPGERPTTSRRRGPALAAGVAALLLVSFAGLLPLNNLLEGPYRWYGRAWRDRIPLEEAVLYAAIVFLAAPGALLLTRALRVPAGSLARRLLQAAVRRGRLLLLACSLFGLGIATAAGTLLVHHSPLTNEQQTLLFQADLLRSGRLAAPPPRLLQGIDPPGIWVRDKSWTARGQWGHAAVLAAGEAVGSPFTVPHLVAPFLILLVWLLGRELFPTDPHARVAATILAATSPFLLLTTASLNPATSSAAAVLLGAYALTRHVRRGAVGWAVLAGLAFGFDLHVRPMNGAVLGAVLAGMALAGRIVERRSIIPTVLGLAVGLLPSLALHWQLARLGFETHIPMRAMVPTVAAFGRAAADLLRFVLWTSGSALTWLVVVAAGSGLVRRRSDALLLVPVAALFLATMGWDRPPGAETGPAAYLDVLPFFVLFLGRVLSAAYARLGSRGRPALAAGALLGLAVAFATWWPVQAVGLHTSGDAVAGPYRLADTIGLPPSFVLWHAPEPPRSWVTEPRPPSPDGKDTVIYLPESASSWLERALGTKKHIAGRRLYTLYQNWGHVTLFSWRPPPPPFDGEPISRPTLMSEPAPEPRR